MSEARAVTVDGPTDLPADELAEHKRLAAIEYRISELAVLRDSLKKLQGKGADKDKVANQKQMIRDAEAELTALMKAG